MTGVNPRGRRDLGLVTAFWAYVALSNILWGASMQASLAAIGVTDVVWPWNARLAQHVLLYPALIGGLWLSRRIGWQPLWRALPLQLLCGVFFSALARPAMGVAQRVVGITPWTMLRFPWVSSATDDYSGQQGFEWLASATCFLLPYFFGLALLAGFDFYRRYRDSQLRTAALERSLSCAPDRAAHATLAAHVVQNLVMHTIKGQIAWDPARAQSMVVQLSDLLRQARCELGNVSCVRWRRSWNSFACTCNCSSNDSQTAWSWRSPSAVRVPQSGYRVLFCSRWWKMRWCMASLMITPW